jgi:hypothetical protein
MGQRDNVPARSVSCQPPKEGLGRTTTSGSKERDLLSNYRRRLGRVESPRADTGKPGKTAEYRCSRRGEGEGEEMSGDASLRKAKAKVTDARKVRAAQLPSNKGFFIVMACCATGAVAMIALLVAGEIKGARVAPDIEHKAKLLD